MSIVEWKNKQIVYLGSCLFVWTGYWWYIQILVGC